MRIDVIVYVFDAIEIIVDRTKREYDVEANLDAPQVSYREAMGLSGSFRSSSIKLSAKLGSIRQLTWSSQCLYLLFLSSASCAASTSLSWRFFAPPCIDCETIIISTFSSYKLWCEQPLSPHIVEWMRTWHDGGSLTWTKNNANIKSSILQTTKDSRWSHYCPFCPTNLSC